MMKERMTLLFPKLNLIVISNLAFEVKQEKRTNKNIDTFLNQRKLIIRIDLKIQLLFHLLSCHLDVEVDIDSKSD
jgi:hypothetical protein